MEARPPGRSAGVFRRIVAQRAVLAFGAISSETRLTRGSASACPGNAFAIILVSNLGTSSKRHSTWFSPRFIPAMELANQPDDRSCHLDARRTHALPADRGG